ncbi:hypothetical protein OVA24_07875 [Luteolibacter sp. SL250]|uniref:hypothetical protein n=1 Tax=Luteolibacter sp. SL250 TaxID=2995170 RepID=UPI00226E99D5|nr:hypothetical protein [Luteolibacter sp. SL250]WAC21301.1 hypothetical protein OVA24_07875 [Luteolibacter sp. SL250]
MITLLLPKIQPRQAWLMAKMAVAGALVSGCYGILHDQITYTISPEYFTRFKFDQFRAADFGLHERIFVAEIGFLATWWVGFFAGWFLGRIAVPAWPAGVAWRKVGQGFLLVFAAAAAAGAFGWLLGLIQDGTGARWVEMCAELGVEDVRAFTHVGYIHNAGYMGGLIGLVVAILWMREKRDKRIGGK